MRLRFLAIAGVMSAVGWVLLPVSVAMATPGKLTLASVSSAGVKGDSHSYVPSLSADGTKVAFVSWAGNLTPSDLTDTIQVYVKDLTSGEVTLASASSSGEPGDSWSTDLSLSGDGTKVAFQTYARNLGGGANDNNIFVKDLRTGDLIVVSTFPPDPTGIRGSYWPSISGDGTKVVFESQRYWEDASGGNLGLWEIYLKDLTTGSLTRVSALPNGRGANGHSH